MIFFIDPVLLDLWVRFLPSVAIVGSPETTPKEVRRDCRKAKRVGTKLNNFE